MNINFLYELDDTSRHNLVVVRCDTNSLNDAVCTLKSNGINAVNIGRELSEKLNTIETAKFLFIESQEYLQELIENEARPIVAGRPKVVAIYNLGILLEPALGLNAAKLLKEISKTVTIVILWNHIYSDGILHWGVQQEQYHLNLSDIVMAEESKEYEV